jgi:vacuolar-type H+-ATPase subunit I/STV1
MIELETIHCIFDILIIILFPIMGLIGFSTYNRFRESNFKKLLIPLFAGFATMHISYVIRAVNHLLFELEILRAIDIFVLIIGMLMILIFVINAYKFSAEYGFNVSETTKKLREWVQRF